MTRFECWLRFIRNVMVYKFSAVYISRKLIVMTFVREAS